MLPITMAAIRTIFYCQNCGAKAPKWLGKCPTCGEWNTYVEEVVVKEAKPQAWRSKERNARDVKPQKLADISKNNQQRIVTDDAELNRVLGGGIVPGSMVLLGGEPGFGKSTLMLQLSLLLNNYKVLYVSGEESEQQIKMRAERLPSNNTECYILTETNTENIFTHIAALEPDVVIIDSIQT
ncbi:MAG: AAA family ATPase, partial [Chitinophagales bacterium]|nr:AAA family ATPase [Chitinophagales bacterium]